MARIVPLLTLAVIGSVSVPGVASDLAPVERTGQTKCYSTSVEIPCVGTGQDGESQKGRPFPLPRFTDMGDGTIRDNLSGLKWLKEANCLSLPATDGFGRSDWLGALSAANNLGHGTCGLSDGSIPGDWRLPNTKELESLLHFAFSQPALSDAVGSGQWSQGDPFNDVILDQPYWTSTTYKPDPSLAIDIHLGRDGTQAMSNKTSLRYVWPVTGHDDDEKPVFPAQIEKTGQSICYSLSAEIPCSGTGQDGELQRGIPFPVPRFSILRDGFDPTGVVRDNMTGLEWLRFAGCSDLPGTTEGTTDWWGALSAVKSLEDGICGLTDGSNPGDWRLPNVREFQSIIHLGLDSPAIANSDESGPFAEGNPFLGIGGLGYWTSTTNSFIFSAAFAAQLGSDGAVISKSKVDSLRVWPVKGQSVEAWIFASGFESGNLVGWTETSLPVPDCEQIAVTDLGDSGTFDWRATISNGLDSEIVILRTKFTWVPDESPHRVDYFALDVNGTTHDYYGGNDYGPITEVIRYPVTSGYSVNADIRPNDLYTSWFAHMLGGYKQPGVHELCFDFIVRDLPFPEAHWLCADRCTQYVQP